MSKQLDLTSNERTNLLNIRRLIELITRYGSLPPGGEVDLREAVEVLNSLSKKVSTKQHRLANVQQNNSVEHRLVDCKLCG